ncbi:uncharacterized protein LOC135123066 isoform X2 [Zophobas morio]|uniref:uncharacterized protein LOC135123064 isoform X2 n=1 Tax=Zophobas morio TaxID=2755281 RepID=UPI0030829E14
MEGTIIYKNKCSVPGCDDKVSKRHRFPKEEQLLKKWIENVNAPLFSSMEPSELYNKYVCDRHFSTDFKVPGTRRGLRRDAFPNICLSAVVLQGKEEDDVHLTSMVEEAASVTSDFIQSPVIPNVEDETCLSPPQNNSCTTPPMKSSRKRGGILHSVDTTRQAQLTPRCKRFYSMALNWSVKQMRMGKKIGNLRMRLAQAEKVSQSPEGLLHVKDNNTDEAL